MKKDISKLFFEKSMDYMVKEQQYELELLRGISSDTFEKITMQEFVSDYCWAIYVAAMKENTLKKYWPGIKSAYYNFNIEKLCEMQCPNDEVISAWGSKVKAIYFLDGVRLIHKEGFSEFKKRAQKIGMNVFKELPGIGPKSMKLLARNVGLLDTGKDDTHIKKLIKIFDANSMKELLSYLAVEYEEKEGVVDGILWRFCADEGYKKQYGSNSLDEFVDGFQKTIN